MIKNETIEVFQSKLLAWYEKEARVLPWRSDPTPYKVWISEMMLQQTRVDTVLPYFERFILCIPTVKELAAVDEDQLLKLWQGLGYYNRALNLKKAAQMIEGKFNGQIPSDIGALMSLPGIGVYSSGAIASIAFGRRVSAIDGNVLRIMARITGSMEDIGSPKTKKHFETLVAGILPEKQVGDFNQALMDLGATVCLAKGEPKCTGCPVKDYCEAYKEGMTGEIPVKGIKKTRRMEKKTVLVISSNDKFALRKRDGGGLLPNLWEFPNFEGELTENQCKEILSTLGIKAKDIICLKASKHIFTHLEWHMKGFFVLAELENSSPDFIWITKEEIKHLYSIPTAFKAYIKFALANKE